MIPESSGAPSAAQRVAIPRRYLMCPPDHFAVTYAINPWMHPDQPVDASLAARQWETLRDAYLRLGHQVEAIKPIEGLPDMVFAANGATVVGGKVLGASFRNKERVPEGPAYMEWFRKNGFAEIHDPQFINEGEGDFLYAGDWILAGHGFRSDPNAHLEAQEFFGMPVIGLRLVDPRFYHLDTALTVLDHETIAYYPEAFSPGSRAVLNTLYPNAVIATAEDAAAFGLNAVSDGKHVLLPQAATGMAAQLAERGYEPIGMDLSELLKAGGSVKCCTLELRG
ncbi:dimethylargininase [Catenulispora pinisilvae]|uniref:dimethylargininase n=1 Tax=Catenulispora pinisilvae TaxID=2705253 RepID=UPI001891EE2A|nr:dimethylargininase [Catenulispora pinisilvae]